LNIDQCMLDQDPLPLLSRMGISVGGKSPLDSTTPTSCAEINKSEQLTGPKDRKADILRYWPESQLIEDVICEKTKMGAEVLVEGPAAFIPVDLDKNNCGGRNADTTSSRKG
jgi:hypothetical protein